MAAKERWIIKDAYDSIRAEGKSFIYISELRERSGLAEERFKIAFDSLLKGEIFQAEIGFDGWTDGDKTPYLYDGEEFFGVKCVGKFGATEKLWRFRAEIVEKWDSMSKGPAANFGEEKTGVASNTAKTVIQGFHFLTAEFAELETELETARQKNIELEAELAKAKDEMKRITTLETAHKGLLAEIDTLNRTIDAERQAKASMEAEIKPEPLLNDEGDEDMTAKAEITTLKGQMADLQEQFKSMQDIIFSGQTPAPAKRQRIQGYSITLSKRGYFIASKRVGEKTDSIHLGKDAEKLEKVLTEKLAKRQR